MMVLDPPPVACDRVTRRHALAARLRADAIRCTTVAGSGHPTSALSAADLMAVLLDGHLRRDPHRRDEPADDHLVVSKGHAAPLLYAMLKAAGVIDDEQLLSLRREGSPLAGHPTPAVPWVDAATGSLGQGLAIAVGIALGARYDRSQAVAWVLLGDSEMAEGSNWEAFEKAAYHRLDRIVAIIDVNRLGQRGETELGWDTDAYRLRAEAFGWRALVIDGHDVEAIERAYVAARSGDGRPTCIVARTEKGHGVSFLADRDGWHGKTLDHEQASAALDELAAPATAHAALVAPPPVPPRDVRVTAVRPPTWHAGERVATRVAYGEALRALGAAREDIVVLDAEVGNSTGAETFASAWRDRYVEAYISEQAMVSMAQGLAVNGRRIVFASTFAAFLTRAHDQIRMTAVSGADLRLCGSHAGVSIGEDGPSQMALEDLAMMRAVHGSTVLYPCDAVSAARLVLAMVDQRGISYLRTTRGATAVIYGSEDDIRIGGSSVLRSSDRDAAVVFTAGVTVHEALAAADALAAQDIALRVVDCYSIKPLDAVAIVAAVRAVPRVIVAEDHRPEGGLGEAVLTALAEAGVAATRFAHLAVRTMPVSATPAQQLERHGLSARAIADVVRAML